MSSDPAPLPEPDEHEDAIAERASLELRDQVARAQRVVDDAREFLSRTARSRDRGRAAG